MQLTFPNTEILEIIPTDDSHRYRAIMGDHLLNIHFSLPYYKEIPKGTFTEFLSETYTLTAPATIKKINTKHFDYQLVMESKASLLKGFKFKNPNDHTLKFPYTATPRQHLQLLIDSLKQRGEIWQIGSCIEAHEKLISYNHNNCAEALQMIAQAFETEWHIEGKTLHLGKVEFYKDNPLPLSYGKGNGFKSGVSRTNESPKITRLFVQGGERNIDYSKYGNKTLLLPKNKEYSFEGTTYISDNQGFSISIKNMPVGATNEQSLDLSHIYPKRSGVISSVIVANESKNFYDFSDNSIPADCDFSALQIKGEKMTIYFESGMLSGREFEVSKYIHSQKLFKLVPKEEDGVTMPNAIFIPKVGDKYAVFGMQMPQTYICNDANQTGASWEMMKEAVKHFSENKNDSFTFKGDLDGIFAKKNWATIGDRLKLGAYIHFSDANFQKENVKIRIVGLKEFLNNPYSPQIELSNKVQGTGFSSQIQKIKNQEVLIEKAQKDAMSFTKRSFRDAEENLKMIEASVNGFSKGINPATIQTMAMLVGDKSLQFDFIHSKINPQKRTFSIFFDKNTKKIHAGGGWLKHFTLGVEEIKPSRPANDFKHWLLPDFVSGYLQPFDKPFYLYAKVSKQNETGEFVLSENPISLEEVPNFYHLLVANINSETSGERGIALMYGFTEVLPGQIKVDKLSSTNGLQYIELLDDRININANVIFSAENRQEITQLAQNQVNTSVQNLQIGGRNLLRNSKYINGNGEVGGIKYVGEITEMKAGETYIINSEIIIGRTNTPYYLNQRKDWSNGRPQSVGKNTPFIATDDHKHLWVWVDFSTNQVEHKNIKLEKGNKATDWSPAPEDLLAEAQSKINQTTQESKVAWETFATLQANNAGNQALESAKAFAQAKDQEKETLVKAYADGKITQAERNAIAVAEAKSRLAEVNAKAHADGKITQEERRAIADAEAKLQEAKNHATQTVNNLQIGNRNHVLKSRLTMNTVSVLDGGTKKTVTDPVFGAVIQYDRPNGGGNFQFQFDVVNRPYLNGKDLIFNVIAKPIGTGTNAFCFGLWSKSYYLLTQNSNKKELGNGWFSYWTKVNLADVGQAGAIGLNSVRGSWQFYAVGIFESTHYVDWSPAPEDIDNQINSVQSSLQNSIQTAKAELERIINIEKENIKTTTLRVQETEKKTNFLQSTNIHGNVVASGVMMVGNSQGANAGINGTGVADNEVRFWAGSSFAERNTASFRVENNGTLHAQNAMIEGSIVSERGKIGGFGIAYNKLHHQKETRGNRSWSRLTKDITELQKERIVFKKEIYSDTNIKNNEPPYMVKETVIDSDEFSINFTKNGAKKEVFSASIDNSIITNPVTISTEGKRGYTGNITIQYDERAYTTLSFVNGLLVGTEL